jgi:hypothetical protein
MVEDHTAGVILDDLSYHLPVFFYFKNQTQVKIKPLIKTIRIIDESTLLDLSINLQTTDWSILENKQPNESYCLFDKTFNSILVSITSAFLPK